MDANVELTPTTLALAPEARAELERRRVRCVDGFIDEAGIGEALVYNRLVAHLMALEGVLDVALEIFPQNAPGEPATAQRDPRQPAGAPGQRRDLACRSAARSIMLDITVDFALHGAVAELGDPATAREVARSEAAARLKDGIAALPVGQTLSVTLLKSMVPDDRQLRADRPALPRRIRRRGRAHPPAGRAAAARRARAAVGAARRAGQR